MLLSVGAVRNGQVDRDTSTDLLELWDVMMMLEITTVDTWIFQICKSSAFWYVFWVKRHTFYTLGRSRYGT